MSSYDKSELVASCENGQVRCVLCQSQFVDKIENIKQHYSQVHTRQISGIQQRSDCVDCDKEMQTERLTSKVILSEEEYWNFLVELTCAEMWPPSIWDEPIMKKLTSPYDDQFGVTTNSETVEHQLNLRCKKAKQKLHGEFDKQPMSVRFNLASRAGRFILGVTAQFINDDGKIKGRFLGIIPIKIGTLAEEIKAKLCDQLAEFNITIDMIYSVTTDNFRNRIHEILEKASKTSVLDEEDEEKEKEAENHFPMEECVGTVKAIEEAIANLLPFKQDEVRCVADLVPLAVEEYLDHFKDELSKLKGQVEDIRSSLKGTDKEEVLVVSKEEDWISTMSMMKSLLTIQPEIDEDIDWELVRGMENLLKPVEQFTRQHQVEQYSAGDFLRDYYICIGRIQGITQPKGGRKKLLAAFQNHEKIFKENINFLAALYLDARFNNRDNSEPLMSAENKTKCVDHIEQTAIRFGIIGTEATVPTSQLAGDGNKDLATVALIILALPVTKLTAEKDLSVLLQDF